VRDFIHKRDPTKRYQSIVDGKTRIASSPLAKADITSYDLDNVFILCDLIGVQNKRKHEDELYESYESDDYDEFDGYETYSHSCASYIY
jgi:hypothetical protein